MTVMPLTEFWDGARLVTANESITKLHSILSFRTLQRNSLFLQNNSLCPGRVAASRNLF